MDPVCAELGLTLFAGFLDALPESAAPPSGRVSFAGFSRRSCSPEALALTLGALLETLAEPGSRDPGAALPADFAGGETGVAFAGEDDFDLAAGFDPDGFDPDGFDPAGWPPEILESETFDFEAGGAALSLDFLPTGSFI